jgi:hypothetical protein
MQLMATSSLSSWCACSEISQDLRKETGGAHIFVVCMGHEKWSSAHGPKAPFWGPPSEVHTLYPLRTKANSTLCYSYACIAQFNNTKFTNLGGLPANLGGGSCPCAYQRIKRSEATNIFYKEPIICRCIEPNLASFSPTKTGELTITPGIKGKLHPLLQLHTERSFTRPSQIFL